MKSLKNGAVTRAKLGKNVSTQGPAGPAGPAGAAGAKGDSGATNVTRHSAFTVVANGNTGESTVNCPAGGSALSGWGEWNFSGIALSRPLTDLGLNGPIISNGHPVGWRVSSDNVAGSPLNLVVNVICAQP